jgi:biopolymer transport protein ExbD
MRPKILALTGLVAAVIALVVALWSAHWLKTRTHELINRPVTVEKGVINSGAFEIERDEAYWFEIELKSSTDDGIGGSCSSTSLQTARWRMYRLGDGAKTETALWEDSQWFYGRQRGFAYEFGAEAGKYWLQWEVPGDAGCLNARQPRLRIWRLADEDEFLSVMALDACLIFGGLGLALVLSYAVPKLQKESSRNQAIRMFPEMPLRNVIPWHRRRPMPRFREIPNFGIFYGGVLWLLVITFMIVIPWPPHGLLVDFREEKVVGVEKSPWAETVSVYVDARKGFLLNGQPVQREELSAKLRGELGKQMVWTVYLEADNDCSYMDAVYAMDTIQGLGAKLIWITPRTRAEWKQKQAP